MEDRFVEVTEVELVAGGKGPSRKRTIGIAHVLSYSGGGPHGTSVVTLANGETFLVEETYEALKMRLGS